MDKFEKKNIFLSMKPSLIKIFWRIPHRGPFKNYVDKILTIFDYLPTSTWTFFTLNVDKKKHFLTTYLPHLVHVVFEWPQLPKVSLSLVLTWNILLSSVNAMGFLDMNVVEFWKITNHTMNSTVCSRYISVFTHPLQ
jgi:hypothetical protein